MIDRLTAMSWLEGLAKDDWRECHSDSDVQEIARQTLALLKEQDPKPVELHINVYGTRFYFCPKCKRELFHTRNLNFCERCGQAVMWDD